MTEVSEQTPKKRSWLGVRTAAATLPLVAVFAAYLIRADATYALTIWPAWVPGLLGLASASLLLFRAPWRFRAPVLAAWLLFTLGFSTEWRSLARFGPWPSSEWAAARKEGRALRIVSLNCGGGILAAAEEVAAFKPDIVLLQESPGRRPLEDLTRKIFGSEGTCVWGVDATILVRGSATQQLAESNRTAAYWNAPKGQRLLLVSARFTPPLLRMDYWNLSCWTGYADSRRLRREEVQEAAAGLSRSAPTIFGGDLNSPPDDGIFRPLIDAGLTDSFSTAGRGWGATAINDFPMVRIDQVWLSSHFEPGAVYVIKTANSDHCMVICDVFLKE